MSGSALAGRRVLVLEDEFIIADFFEAALSAADCVVVGPVAHSEQALRLLEAEPVDAGLLDVRLRDDEDAVAVADRLSDQGLPFVFVTGHGLESLPPRYRDRPCIMKPCDADTVVAALASAVASSGQYSGVWRSRGGTGG